MAFDALGRVIALAVIGPNGEGDSLSDPTVEFEYETDRWGEEGLPNRAHVRSRETHADANTRYVEKWIYSDGGGNLVQEKVKVEPGLAPSIVNGEVEWNEADPRYVGSGRTVVDNKGNPVKQYEPFFSTTFDYDDEAELVEWGVTPVMTYDPTI